jgi:hypothetical protein
MPNFTVIGYYPDNDQPWAENQEADSWQEAVELCRGKVEEGGAVRVCGVIEGNHSCVDDLNETLELAND